MVLAAGTKLGPYEILAPIGAGGMGEVYRARDPRVNRVVAIKVTQERFSDRFQKEAEAIAALNDPHICQLYDVGPNYLVMEFIDGAPLKGPLPVDQTLKYAGQICDALDAAHSKGVTHRDLKPGNILVTKAGVKLLDFGLARMEGGENLTVTMGEVKGTPAYMSPEQWEGQPGDARSDIYAFGCVLYEMLTGKRAVGRRVPVEPAALENLVSTCLARDPEDRWQSAKNLRLALMTVGTTSTAKNPWLERAAWAGALTVAVILLLMLAPFRRNEPIAGRLSRWTVNPPAGTSFATPTTGTVPVAQFALSPDGQVLVFAAAATDGRSALWLRSLTETEPRLLPGTEDAEYPFWSPDNRWVAFFAAGKLKKLQISGGLVQEVNDTIAAPRGGSWGPDDTILFAYAGSPIFRVPAAGGTPTPVTRFDVERQEGSHRWPHFLPDGRHFLYVAQSGSPDQGGIYAGSLDGSVNKLIVRSTYEAAFAPPRFLLFMNGTTLLAQAFDPDRLALSGQPFAVAENVGRSTTVQAAFSASSTGLLAYAGTMVRPGKLNWYDRGGTLRGSEGVAGDYSDFRLSPDGKRLAVSLVDPQTGIPDIWFNDLARGGSQRQTFGPIINASVVWSPDGDQVVFRAVPGGVGELRRKSAAGGGNTQTILTPGVYRAAGMDSANLIATDWSPDGKSLILSDSSSSDYDLWLLSLSGNAKPIRLVKAPGDQFHGNFSPDGRLVAYSSNESGRFEVNVRKLSGSDQQWQVSTNGGYEPRWRADGREIYYLSEDRKLMAVTVGPGPTFAVPQTLFQTNVSPGVNSLRAHYVPSGDGQRFLIHAQMGDPASEPITIVLNWTTSLH